VYRIRFFYQNRKNLLKLLKNNFEEIKKKLCQEEKNLNKIEYIINYFTNSFLNSKSKKESEQNSSDNNILASIQKNRKEDNNYDKNNTEVNQESQSSENISSFYIPPEIFKNKVKSILQKSRIIIDIDKLNFQFYYGENLDKYIDNVHLSLNVNYDKYIKSQQSDNESKIIYKNYQKFLQFLKAIVEYLKHIKIKFNPRIILELKRENSLVNSESKNKEYKDIYAINCEYIFINQLKGNEELRFCDRNNIISNKNNESILKLIEEK
jgi:hypothetical protein